jgi:GT2 family glycosyltransferase
MRQRIGPVLHATLDVVRGRGTREGSALVASVALSYVILPLLLAALAVLVGSWWLRAVLLVGAVGVITLGAVLHTHLLFGTAIGGPRWTSRGKSVRSAPPPGHSHQLPVGWQPGVTVVVTAYNDSRFLGEALVSLIEQDFADFECIVVDDGSTDLTMDVAVAFAAADDRFRVVQHEGNAGLPAARNTGLSFARAAWVTFLDADDFLWPQALSRRLDVIGGDPQCAGAYCDWRAVSPDSSPRQRADEARALHRVTFSDTQWDTPFIASAPILRTAIVRALGGFSEILHSAEDFDFYLRVLRAGYWFEYARYVGVGYRQVDGSMIRDNPALHFEVVRSVIDAVETEIEPDAIPGSVAAYTHPLSYYVRETKVLRRQLRFLALALLTGRAEQVERMLARIDRDLLRRPLPFDPVEDPYRYAVQRVRLQDVAHAAQRAELRHELVSSLGPLMRSTHDPGSGIAAAPAAEETVRPRAGVTARTGRPVGVRELHRLPELATTGLEDHARGTVILVPQSRYHVDELGPLAEELSARGVPTSFMVPDSAPATVLTELSRYTDVVLSWDAALPDRSPVAGVVVLNDWGPTRELVECADRHGAPTFAKVEGVQDFTDADTGQQRLPYRRVRYVLGQGPNDAKALADRDVAVVGSSRLERIWQDPPSQPGGLEPVLVNFNFTYNVLTNQADDWILSVQGGIEDAGREFLVSQHPALKTKHSTHARHVTSQPIRHEVIRAAALVSRFSTVLYEAMARGVPVIYHNPHGERVPDFQDPRGAFPKTASRVELRDAVRELASWQVDYRKRCASFFTGQVDVDPERRSEVRGAAFIAGLL